MAPIQIVDVNQLDEEKRRAAAMLVKASLPEFYRTLSTCVADLDARLASNLGQKGGELAHSLAALDSQNTVCGFLSALPSRELAIAQITDFRFLTAGLRSSDKAQLREALSSLSSTIQPITGNTYYLSRISVADTAQGQGLGKTLLGIFLEEAGSYEAKTLHVERTNSRAIGFYKSCGFEFATGWEAYRFPAMSCTAGTGSA